MTNPIEVAAQALIPYSGASTNRELQARKTFESIGVDDLEGVIRKVMLRGAIVADVDLPTYIALAVKAHLTGKEQKGTERSIPQPAVDAACDAYHRPGRMITNTAVGSHYDRMTAALEAALPHIRKQVADEIRAEMPKLTTRAATQTLRVCMEHSARIAEKGTEQ